MDEIKKLTPSTLALIEKITDILKDDFFENNSRAIHIIELFSFFQGKQRCNFTQDMTTVFIFDSLLLLSRRLTPPLELTYEMVGTEDPDIISLLQRRLRNALAFKNFSNYWQSLYTEDTMFEKE